MIINNNPTLITSYTLPDITIPIAPGERFNDAVTLSLRILHQWFLEPNKVVILESFKIGEVPLLVVRYANKKLALRIDYIQDYRYSDALKADSDVIEGKYTEALRVFASDNDFLAVLAGILTHTDENEIKRKSNVTKVYLHDKEIYIREPLLKIAEAPFKHLSLNYPYPLDTKKE
jgi:hypothetical protein